MPGISQLVLIVGSIQRDYCGWQEVWDALAVVHFGWSEANQEAFGGFDALHAQADGQRMRHGESRTRFAWSEGLIYCYFCAFAKFFPCTFNSFFPYFYLTSALATQREGWIENKCYEKFNLMF